VAKREANADTILTEDTSVVDENVDGAEGSDGLGDNLLAVRDGADSGNGLATSCEELTWHKREG
jgi:hypothetical protein